MTERAKYPEGIDRPIHHEPNYGPWVRQIREAFERPLNYTPTPEDWKDYETYLEEQAARAAADEQDRQDHERESRENR